MTYVSGRISDDPNFVEKFNRITGNCYNPVNAPKLESWEEYMIYSLDKMDFCNSIVFIDTEFSAGMKIERIYARMRCIL
jgi:hypothetical protein